MKVFTSIVLVVIFALCMYGIKIRNDQIKTLMADNFTQQTKIMNMQAYIDSQEVKIKWRNFLELMLDKEQKIRMDVLEEWVVSEGVLYKPIKPQKDNK